MLHTVVKVLEWQNLHVVKYEIFFDGMFSCRSDSKIFGLLLKPVSKLSEIFLSIVVVECLQSSMLKMPPKVESYGGESQ